MRLIGMVLLLLVVACDARFPWQDVDPWLDDLNELAEPRRS